MKSALIVVDMLNTYEHEDSELLTASVRQALPAMGALIVCGSGQGGPQHRISQPATDAMREGQPSTASMLTRLRWGS